MIRNPQNSIGSYKVLFVTGRVERNPQEFQEGQGHRVETFRLKVQGLGYRLWGFGFRV